ncbi:MAG: hypothetical protein JWL77_4135 [Chthonomonadaceae bacterium]|nr:hypothetical protein [Chthonomonadaceae bacterium]
MKRQPPQTVLFLATIGVLLIAWYLWRRVPQEPQLLDRSQRVASIAGWHTELFGYKPGLTYSSEPVSSQIAPELTSSSSLAGLPSRQRFRVLMTEPNHHYQIMAETDGNGPPAQIYHDTAPPHYDIDEESLFSAFLGGIYSSRLSGPSSASGTSEGANVFRVNYTACARKSPMSEHMIRIGRNKKVENVCISADGSHIFFEERSWKQDPYPQWVYKLVPLLSPRSHNEKCVLIVADIKSGKRKELAAYEVPPQISQWYDPQLYVQDVQWAPDGKHLSFIYRENLYTIPVE